MSGADQKNSGVSSTVESRLTADRWMNTSPMSLLMSLRPNNTRPVGSEDPASSPLAPAALLTRQGLHSQPVPVTGHHNGTRLCPRPHGAIAQE